jgi:DNA-binding transcriptional regulator WhiA
MNSIVKGKDSISQFQQDDLTRTSFWDGFFYFFGFMDNPAEKKCHKIISTSINTQIKSDLQRIKQTYNKQYELMRKEALSLE